MTLRSQPQKSGTLQPIAEADPIAEHGGACHIEDGRYTLPHSEHPVKKEAPLHKFCFQVNYFSVVVIICHNQSSSQKEELSHCSVEIKGHRGDQAGQQVADMAARAESCELEVGASLLTLKATPSGGLSTTKSQLPTWHCQLRAKCWNAQRICLLFFSFILENFQFATTSSKEG